MENKNRYMAVAYHLYAEDENGQGLVEVAKEEQPFQFITGFGIALNAFEANVANLEKDKEFDFTLEKEEAYGDRDMERVLDLERNMFCIDGRFDHEHIYPDAVIPLQNEEGTRFYGRVLEVGTDTVKVDLNHPLAGQKLQFKGKVMENREATNEEIQQLIKQLTGGCGGCGGNCHGGCGSDGDCECGCGCK